MIFHGSQVSQAGLPWGLVLDLLHTEAKGMSVLSGEMWSIVLPSAGLGTGLKLQASCDPVEPSFRHLGTGEKRTRKPDCPDTGDARTLASSTQSPFPAAQLKPRT